VADLEVGYHVRTALQGRGLASEAAAACRDYARDVLGAAPLIAIIDPRDRPSQRVAEKLGLVVERYIDNHGRWRHPQRVYAASPPSCATPTAARWPNASTSTSSPRPPPGWPG
jgi:Acetyltransferase (GNAT) domain